MKKEDVLGKITSSYDEDADVLYITLGSGEASFCEEVDDIVLIERGMYSGNVTGFRILNFSEHADKACLLLQARAESTEDGN